MEFWSLIIIIVILSVIVIRLSFFKSFYQKYNDGISIIENNTIVDCNDKLLKLFKYDTKEDFLSLHPFELSPAFQPDGSFSVEKATKMMEEAKKEGYCTFDWVFLTSDGQERWTEINIFKIDNIIYKNRYCMIWKDISKRIEAENELKKFNDNLENLIEKEINKNKEHERMLFIQSRQAQLGEMISMIAHQWRQPLAAISATAIDMKMKIHFHPTKDENNELLTYLDNELDDIETYTQNLTHTIDDFRDFYKPDKKPETKSINDPVKKAFSIVKTAFESDHIEVNFSLDSNIETELYEHELIQVFLNIFKNSQDNFESKEVEHKEISVTTKEDDNFIIARLCDNGGGISNDIIDKIFEPYFSTKSEKNGTGLGLYMSLKIIEEHHKGKIEVKNSGEGVCFTIKIPIDNKKSQK